MIDLPSQLTFRLVMHGFFLLLLGMGITPAHAVTLDFAGLNDGPFTEYTQAGYTVSPVSGNWLGTAVSSYVYFINPKNRTKITSSVRITRNNATFRFASVDLYSSTTDIPYVFSGYLKSKLVYQATRTVPPTSGNFVTEKNPIDSTVIDKLEISLTNDTSPCCANNPMGLDNIVLTSSTDYLDIAALPDVNGDGVLDQAVLVMKGDSYYLQSIDSATGKLIMQALLGTVSAITPKSLASVGQQISILASKGTGASILQIRDSATLVLVKTLTLPK